MSDTPVSGCGCARCSHAEIERLRRERDALRELYDAKIPLHERRKLPSPVWNESDDALTASFWPDCTCVECYALHHMAEARATLASLHCPDDAACRDAKVRELQAALATARRDALEEAAQVCDGRAKVTVGGKTYWATTEEHARAIRALAEKEPK